MKNNIRVKRVWLVKQAKGEKMIEISDDRSFDALLSQERTARRLDPG